MVELEDGNMKFIDLFAGIGRNHCWTRKKGIRLMGNNEQNIIIYQNADGNIKLDVHLQDDSVKNMPLIFTILMLLFQLVTEWNRHKAHNFVFGQPNAYKNTL